MSSPNSLVKQAVASWTWRLSARRRRPGCIVLMYHRIGKPDDPFPHLGVAELRRHLEWLAVHCDVIEPAALREKARQPSRTRPPVLLTFDDGNRDYYELAYPLLKEFGMPAVVFLITEYIDHPRLLWWDRLHLAVHGARVNRVSLPWHANEAVPLGPCPEQFVCDCERYLKSVPDEEKDRLLDDLIRALGDPVLPDVGRQTMTWDEVRATMDLTTYGGHTHTHPLVSKIARDRLEHEIRTCRDRICAETGVPPTLFAYPNGDITAEAKALLAHHGFDVAFSTLEGLNDETTDWLEVRRVAVGSIVPTRWMITRSWI